MCFLHTPTSSIFDHWKSFLLCFAAKIISEGSLEHIQPTRVETETITTGSEKSIKANAAFSNALRSPPSNAPKKGAKARPEHGRQKIKSTIKITGLYTFFEGGQLLASLFLLLQCLFYIRVQSCFWKHFSPL